MRVLMDTHFLVWAIYDDSKIPAELMDLLSDDNVTVEYSIVSLWESEIKHRKHPDKFDYRASDLNYYAQLSDYRQLDLAPEHIYALSGLKDEKETGHKDLFDKMLIAQARSENMLFVTHDKRLLAYNEPCVRYF